MLFECRLNCLTEKDTATKPSIQKVAQVNIRDLFLTNLSTLKLELWQIQLCCEVKIHKDLWYFIYPQHMHVRKYRYTRFFQVFINVLLWWLFKRIWNVSIYNKICWSNHKGYQGTAQGRSSGGLVISQWGLGLKKLQKSTLLWPTTKLRIQGCVHGMSRL